MRISDYKTHWKVQPAGKKIQWYSANAQNTCTKKKVKNESEAHKKTMKSIQKYFTSNEKENNAILCFFQINS